jgi:hypothetical protein
MPPQVLPATRRVPRSGSDLRRGPDCCVSSVGRRRVGPGDTHPTRSSTLDRPRHRRPRQPSEIDEPGPLEHPVLAIAAAVASIQWKEQANVTAVKVRPRCLEEGPIHCHPSTIASSGGSTALPSVPVSIPGTDVCAGEADWNVPASRNLVKRWQLGRIRTQGVADAASRKCSRLHRPPRCRSLPAKEQPCHAL